MKERPILFSAEMVRAILDGRKTQTRRVVKYIPQLGDVEQWCPRVGTSLFDDIVGDYRRFCKHGQPEDMLWVRETHWRIPHAEPPMTDVYYAATDELPVINQLHSAGLYKKYSSLFMPRWASRIMLKIKNVRIDRLQNISDDDAVNEGLKRVNQCGILRCAGYKDYSANRVGFINPVRSFESLWDSINGNKENKRWQTNPWVWVIEFEKMK